MENQVIPFKKERAFRNVQVLIAQCNVLGQFTNIRDAKGESYNISNVVIDSVSKNVKTIHRENLLAVGNTVLLSGEDCVIGQIATDMKGNSRRDEVGNEVVYGKDHYRVNNFQVLDTNYRIDDLDLLVADKLAEKMFAERTAKKKVSGLIQRDAVPSEKVETPVNEEGANQEIPQEIAAALTEGKTVAETEGEVEIKTEPVAETTGS